MEVTSEIKNGAPAEMGSDGLVIVDTEVGFWHGGLYWSRDQNGNLITLTPDEYDQMMINGEVIEVV